MNNVDFIAWDKEKEMWTNWKCYDNMFYFMDKNTGVWFRDDEFKRFVLLRDTGIKDRNGKKLHEGDIVKTESFTRNFVFLIKIGEFAPTWLNQVCEKIGLQKQHSIYGVYAENGEEQCIVEENNAFEIIGNIYENPELLEVI